MSGTQPSSALELITTIAITAGSAALFLYWFRYTCMLILSADSADVYAGALAETKGLQFARVQAQLRMNADGELDKLYRALDRDYAIIRPLLETSATDIQDRMLGVYYHTLRTCYVATRAFSPSATRRTLNEMATVIAHFANAAGEAAAAA